MPEPDQKDGKGKHSDTILGGALLLAWTQFCQQKGSGKEVSWLDASMG